MDADLGRLERNGDRVTLTFTRRLPHPPEKVWRAVTEPEHLAAWYPQRIEGEWRAGARLRFHTSDDPDDAFDGEVLAFEPPSVLEMTWGSDRLRLEVRPDGNGTLLTLIDSFSEVGKAARDAAGWHECLDRLEAELGRAELPDWGERWREVHPAYVERFGPEAATIGPPEG
jgi:uncharacterized protein YndB with AHSA1/START domain